MAKASPAQRDNGSKLEELKKELKDSSTLAALARRLTVLSDLHRLKILYLLLTEHELCVQDMARTLDVSVSALSHQLRTLRAMDMVVTRRAGQMIYYRLPSDLFAKQLSCIFNNH